MSLVVDESRHRLRHQPGLDGLRGLAVVLVVLFHADLDWMSGGFLGVSIFFTLSGFLITSLLLAEREDAGSVDLRAFWSRRLRRLAPASLITIITVVALSSWLSTTAEAWRLRGDAVSAALYVSNWRFVLADYSYADLFSAPSPLLHIWSLSIEEQLYVVLPLLVFGAIALRWSNRRVGIALFVVAMSSTIVGVAVSGTDRVYYGTDTRAAELFLGAVLACFGVERFSTGASDRFRRSMSLIAPIAFVAVIVLAVVSDPRSRWIEAGGLPAFALLSVVLVVGSIVAGPLRSVLSWSPLRAVGRVSYGVYLFHWPILVYVTPERLGVGGWRRIVVCVLLTGVLAAVSHRLVERPIRERRLLSSAGAAGSMLAVAVSVSVVLPLVVLASGPSTPSTTPVVLVTTTQVVPPTTGSASSPTSVSPVDRALTVLVIGDSTANNVARALADVGDPDLGVVDAGVIGCPLVLATRVYDVPGEFRDATYCPFPAVVVSDALEWTALDAIVVAVGPPSRWAYRALNGERVDPGDDQYFDDLDRTIDALVDVADGRPIVVFDAPYVRDDDEVLGDDPDLVDLWNSVVDDWGTRDGVAVYEYSRLFAEAGSELDRQQRPDGVHLEREYAAELARDVIVPDVRSLIDSLRRP